MFRHYKQTPKGDYLIPFNIEIKARNNLIDFYLREKKGYAVHDRYIEDLVVIRESGKLNEYVFFTFNPGNWVNINNYDEDNFSDWMNQNIPEHIPLTLAFVAKVE
jgi:hypothetical protein